MAQPHCITTPPVHPPIHVATRIHQCQRVLPRLSAEGQREVIAFMYEKLAEGMKNGN